jgi:bifunctional non-homologous end joining protein LigD
MQLYVPVSPTPADRASAFAKELAQQLEATHPELVVSRMTKNLRSSKVFVDWSQNNAAKTTIAPYSLRARAEATASTPLTWDEVKGCKVAEDLRFTAADVLQRVDELGDLLAGIRSPDRPALPTAERD